ncbi:MAG: hypothetical protein QF775_02950 [archaeon]|nr:hypothetical protein [archaeon]
MMSFGGGQFPVSVPEADPNYVWATNRDTLAGNWYPINSPITEGAVGRSTFGGLGEDPRFLPEHHGMNISAESRMSDEQLRQNLQNWNLPAEGNREELFARNMRVKHHPTFMRNFAEGRAPNEAEIADIANPNAPIGLREANRLRNLRQEAGYYENIPPVRPQRPMPGAVTRTLADLGRAPIAGAQGAQAAAGGAEALGAGEAAAATEAGALSSGLGTAGMFAARALPIVNVALMGTMLYNMMRSQNQAQEAEARRKEMRI